MGRIFLIFCFLAIAVSAQAATLKWTGVPDTETMTIKGYIVHWRVAGWEEWWFKKVGNVSEVQLTTEEGYHLKPGQEYEFSVSAYSTDHIHGEPAEPITYTPKLPEIEENPQPEPERPVVLRVNGVQITVEEIPE